MALIDGREPVTLQVFKSTGYVRRLANGHSKSDAVIRMLFKTFGIVQVAQKSDPGTARYEITEYTGRDIEVWHYYDGNGGGSQVYVRTKNKATYEEMKVLL